jgi:hypothetical protein
MKKIIFLFCFFLSAFTAQAIARNELRVFFDSIPSVETDTVSVAMSDTTIDAEIDSTGSLPVVLHITLKPPLRGESFGDWVQRNWVSVVAIALFILELSARFTPSEMDNSLVNLLKRIFDSFFPNRNIKGGTH